MSDVANIEPPCETASHDGSAMSLGRCSLSAEERTARVVIASLLPADSPRSTGEDTKAHTFASRGGCEAGLDLVVRTRPSKLASGTLDVRAHEECGSTTY